jgi:hypothetical protein
MRKKNKLDHFNNFMDDISNRSTWIERAIICVFVVTFTLIIAQFIFMGLFSLKIYNNLDNIGDSINSIKKD